ncbi:LysE family translocator [uncultured Methylibium sp.]|uniref:LysE family translocator n=1 Tax=uncultured Methylibium sp. TaxID=381093 RepID=UPI0025D54AB9|nr:LysE family translocator [uncultured Methylibium sp.]
MSPTEHAPLVVYTLALTLNPGPSSLLIAASGARFGVARCTPHLAGSLLGYELQLLAGALGTGAAVFGNPLLQTVMQVLSTVYLLWLGWRMLGSRGGLGAKAAPPAPISWQQAFVLQVSNPKSWMTAVASAGLFLPAASPATQQAAFLLFAGGAGVTGLATWAVAGAALQRWLHSPTSQLVMNRGMAGMLAVTALWGLGGAVGDLSV